MADLKEAIEMSSAAAQRRGNVRMQRKHQTEARRRSVALNSAQTEPTWEMVEAEAEHAEPSNYDKGRRTSKVYVPGGLPAASSSSLRTPPRRLDPCGRSPGSAPCRALVCAL